MAGQRVGGVRAADYDQLGSEWAEPLDLLHALDDLAGSRARGAAPSSRTGRALACLIEELNATPPQMPGDPRPITYRLAASSQQPSTTCAAQLPEV